MLPTRCETSAAFCPSVWPDAVAAAAIDSPPSLIRSKRRDTPPGTPSIVSTGLTIMWAADAIGRAAALAAASANSLDLLILSSWARA